MVATRNVPMVRESDGRWQAVATLHEGTMVSTVDSRVAKLPATKARHVMRVRSISQGGGEWLWVTADALTEVSPTNPVRSRGGNHVVGELPPNIQHQSKAIQEAWLEVQEAVAENERLELRLPDPYFARAEILAGIRDFDAALRDYLRAVELADEAGQDVVQHRSYFARLKQLLLAYDATPRPPANGMGRDHYIAGVHAYWQGDTEVSISHLTNAIAVEPQKPIYWYFRALANKKSGQEVRARHDALMGAHVEWRDGEADLLGGSLQRVQGNSRSWLEDYRRGDPRQRLLVSRKAG